MKTKHITDAIFMQYVLFAFIRISQSWFWSVHAMKNRNLRKKQRLRIIIINSDFYSPRVQLSRQEPTRYGRNRSSAVAAASAADVSSN